MTDLRSAAQQALEALQNCANGEDDVLLTRDALAALRAALAEPPVDDPHRDHWVAIAEAAQKIAASTECGLAEAKALCTALDRLTEAALAEPQEPVQEALTIERLRDALVASRIVPPAAVEDPDEYDDGVTLHHIDALHRRLA